MDFVVCNFSFHLLIVHYCLDNFVCTWVDELLVLASDSKNMKNVIDFFPILSGDQERWQNNFFFRHFLDDEKSEKTRNLKFEENFREDRRKWRHNTKKNWKWKKIIQKTETIKTTNFSHLKLATYPALWSWNRKFSSWKHLLAMSFRYDAKQSISYKEGPLSRRRLFFSKEMKLDWLYNKTNNATLD